MEMMIMNNWKYFKLSELCDIAKINAEAMGGIYD